MAASTPAQLNQAPITMTETPRVIFLNQYYWPDESATSQILVDLAEHLVAKGAKVTVVTSRHLYSGKTSELPGEATHNGVRIVRIWTSSFGRGWLISRAIDYLTFHVFAFFALISLVSRGDKIVAKTDPPLISVVAWLAAKIKHASVINWCQDLFPELAHALGVKWTSGLIGSMLIGLRNKSLSAAEMNITVSHAMRAKLCLEGIDPLKIRAIHNWPDRCIQPKVATSTALREDWGIGDSFVLGYSGNLGRGHLPDQVLKLIELSRNMDNMKLLFVGDGYGLRHIKSKIIDYNYSHIIFRPRQKRADLDSLLSVPDVHLISLDPSCEDYMMPSKYYGILAAGRPIAFLGSRSAAIACEIVEQQCGIVLDVSRPEAWRADLLALKNRPERLQSMQRKARLLYEGRFTSKAAFRAWEDVILPGTQPADLAACGDLTGVP